MGSKVPKGLKEAIVTILVGFIFCFLCAPSIEYLFCAIHGSKSLTFMILFIV